MKCAYVTLATTKNYLRGAHFLQESLKKVNSVYPLIVLITDNLEQDDYIQSFDSYKIVPYLELEQFQYVRYKDTINKFYIFTLIEYEKILFLDADIFIFDNIDFLFDKFNQYNFLSSVYTPIRVKENFLPLGSCLFLTPNMHLFNQVLSSLDNQYAIDDEFIIKYILFPQHYLTQEYGIQCNIFENFHVYIDKYSYHDAGPNKYFNTIIITPEEFCTLSTSMLRYFFSKWQQTKGRP